MTSQMMQYYIGKKKYIIKFSQTAIKDDKK